MTEQYYNFLLAWILLAVVIFMINLKIVAPYGRHTTKKCGPSLNNSLAWFIMELTALISTTFFTFYKTGSLSFMVWTSYSLFALHYINRAFIFPFRIRDRKKKMPVLIMLFAIIFNSINGYFIGIYFSMYSPQFNLSIASIVVTSAGFVLFIMGFYSNIKSDSLLLNLKSSNSKEYKIPKGFLFEKISCPNHFGEIIEWIGYSLFSLNPGAVAFAVWTMANLIPRSLAHHKWYKSKFENYPENRKAIFPGLL